MSESKSESFIGWIIGISAIYGIVYLLGFLGAKYSEDSVAEYVSRYSKLAEDDSLQKMRSHNIHLQLSFAKELQSEGLLERFIWVANNQKFLDLFASVSLSPSNDKSTQSYRLNISVDNIDDIRAEGIPLSESFSAQAEITAILKAELYISDKMFGTKSFKLELPNIGDDIMDAIFNVMTFPFCLLFTSVHGLDDFINSENDNLIPQIDSFFFEIAQDLFKISFGAKADRIEWVAQSQF